MMNIDRKKVSLIETLDEWQKNPRFKHPQDYVIYMSTYTYKKLLCEISEKAGCDIKEIDSYHLMGIELRNHRSNYDMHIGPKPF